ncbi:MAG TPA: rhomboid family intramembrane serine protease [Terriglobales bacterium]|jgi:membrane associated rhomboid family serine protease|nr:rhomboid family intramembrane serine protease [Terriglobales bacterium]
MSPRYQSFEMGLPPFRGAVRQIILFSTAVYIALLLMVAFAPSLGQAAFAIGTLQPDKALHGWLWQLVTYPFMYADPIQFLLSLVGIYFIGSAVEGQIGSQRFYGLFFGSLILSGAVGVGLSLTGVIAQGPAAGSGAAANAILMVFYLMNRGAPIMLFPIPLQIPIKWVVVGIAAIETAYLLLYHFALQFCVVLLGLGAGYLWYTMFLRRGVSVGLSERIYGLRNAYYRWKRRRAAKKFQVYMRKHDRNVYFDEYGNYKPPDDKRDDERGGWVN